MERLEIEQHRGRERVVIKFGSSSLTTKAGTIDHYKIRTYVDQIAQLKINGYDPVIVSSGAVAAGYTQIGYRKRPKILVQRQAAAAVGQALLMQVYQELFSKHGIVVSQLLLTRMDLSDHDRCHNAFNTLEELLKQGVVPIINENDSVSIHEIKLQFGDNDILSAYVANLVKASHLLMMTDMNGLYTADPRKNPQAEKLEKVDVISKDIVKLAGGVGSDVGTGGMRSKIEAARVAVFGGIHVFVGMLTEQSNIEEILIGNGDGTYFTPSSSSLSVKKQWLSFHSFVRGQVKVDAGAEKAILYDGKSLLPAGIKDVHGEFHAGDVVEVLNPNEEVIGRGISNYDDWQIQAVKGLSSDEVLKRIQVKKIEVIHRDQWVSNIDKGAKLDE